MIILRKNCLKRNIANLYTLIETNSVLILFFSFFFFFRKIKYRLNATFDIPNGNIKLSKQYEKLYKTLNYMIRQIILVAISTIKKWIENIFKGKFNFHRAWKKINFLIDDTMENFCRRWLDLTSRNVNLLRRRNNTKWGYLVNYWTTLLDQCQDNVSSICLSYENRTTLI